MKTLKYEEVLRNEYRDFQDAHASLGEFLERVYNQKRLHSALDTFHQSISRRTEVRCNEVASQLS